MFFNTVFLSRGCRNESIKVASQIETTIKIRNGSNIVGGLDLVGLFFKLPLTVCGLAMFFYWGFGTQILNLLQMFIRCSNVHLTSSAPNKKILLSRC